MPQEKKPEVVVITGASAGLGRAIVRQFAKDRAHIGLIARGEVGLEGAKREVELAGGKALALPTDVSDAQAVEAAAKKVEEEFGPIDIWVNVAMLTVLAPFWEITPEEFKRVTDVTYLGQVNGTYTALRRMVPRDRGTIVNVGSALGYRSIPLQSAYCGAKHGVNGFTDSIRVELMHYKSKVKISLVQMPAMNTPQFTWGLDKMPDEPQPVPPIYQPEVAAQAVHYMAHHPRRQMLVGISTVIVVQANKIFPMIADRYLAKTGFKSQQTGKKKAADQPYNMWEPLDGPGGKDYGARGHFDSQSKDRSQEVWLAEHRIAWMAPLAGAAVAGIAAFAMRRTR